MLSSRCSEPRLRAASYQFQHFPGIGKSAHIFLRENELAAMFDLENPSAGFYKL